MTVVNILLLYLGYCLVNRFVRDRSVFGDMSSIASTLDKINKKTQKEIETRRSGDTLPLKEDIPVLKQPKQPELKLDAVKPEIKIETSFDNMRIGEYKK